MTPAWAQRHEELLRDCLVSPDVFNSMSRSREIRGGMYYQLNVYMGRS